MRHAAHRGVDTQQEAERELVVLEAWRARLCARGLRDAYDRMRRAMLGGQLELSQALQIAGAMDAAMDMLRTTTKRLAPGTEVRAAAEDVLSAFVEWRVASPRTDASRRASARFGARVLALEEAATRASRPDADAPPARDESPPSEAGRARARGGAPRVEAAEELREPTSSCPVITIEETTFDVEEIAAIEAIEAGETDAEAPLGAPEPKSVPPPIPRIPRERGDSKTPSSPARRRGRPRDRA